LKQDKDIAYCICTEGSDLVFPYLRVMLLSLFKHNPWVKGDLVILTCDITPLSTHNREILESIVPNIKYVDIDSKQYNSFSVQNSNRAELLTNLYRINAFSLHGFDFVMYISSLSFCISSIAKLFVGNSDILVANSGTTAISREPGVSAKNIAEFNSSVMIISKEVSDAKLKDAMLARLKNTRRITGSDISNAIRDVIKLNDNNISYQSVDSIVKKSKYNDSKFSQFKAIQSNVAFIELDIGINEKKKTAASFRYKEMNRLWHSYNIQGDWNSYETPSGIVNMNAYVERVKERKVVRGSGTIMKVNIDKHIDDGKVLIIMAAYNSEEFIEMSINSILKQTYKDFILCIIDDNSTDSTYDIAKSISEKDERLIVYKNSINSGAYYSRNIALKLHIHECEYWTIHDADDMMYPNRILAQVASINQNLAATCKFKRIDYYTRKLIGNGISGDHSNILFRKQVFDIIGYYDSSTRFAADSEYKGRLIKMFGKDKLILVNEFLFEAFNHGKNETIITPVHGHKRKAYVASYIKKHRLMNKDNCYLDFIQKNK